MPTRLSSAVASLASVLVVGTIGFRLWGLGWIDAAYQTVSTVTTVGYREVEPFDAPAKGFAIVLMLAGAGTVLYTLSAIMETVLEGHLSALLGRRRMDRRIADISGHIVLCGWGRVGRALVEHLGEHTTPIVVVELDDARLAGAPPLTVTGDATTDAVLRAAGIERAATLVTALETDADNLFVALSGRALNPALFIVARARDASSADKLVRAGADRVVNPQEMGGARMASLIAHPHVAAFLDITATGRPVGFRLEEIVVPAGSLAAGRTINHLAGETTILAIAQPDGTFLTRPPVGAVIDVGDVLIAAGTDAELRALELAVAPQATH